MTIEFQTVPGISEELITMVKNQVMELKHINKDISRAEVAFRQKGEDKVCEIRLTIFKGSFMVLRKGNSFETAAIQALKYLSENIGEEGKKNLQEVVSTVKV